MNAVVVVTGAGGFIGPVVVRTLLEHGARVHAMLGPPGPAVRAVPSAVRSSAGDISDREYLDDSMRGADIVVHMAGPASVRASFEYPREYTRIHVVGTAAVLEACLRAGIQRLIYVSSAEVYGEPGTPTVPEHAAIQPRSPYAAAKASAEQLVEACGRTLGLTSIILRPFSIYGPGLSPHSLIGTILEKVRRNEEVVLHDLRPIRDYCFVDDLGGAVLRSCVVDVSGVVKFNVGTGKGTSVRDMAELILGILRRRTRVQTTPSSERPPESEIWRLVANAARAKDVLGWRASVSLEVGLRHTVAVMKNIP